MALCMTLYDLLTSSAAAEIVRWLADGAAAYSAAFPGRGAARHPAGHHPVRRGHRTTPAHTVPTAAGREVSLTPEGRSDAGRVEGVERVRRLRSGGLGTGQMPARQPVSGGRWSGSVCAIVTRFVKSYCRSSGSGLKSFFVEDGTGVFC